MDTTKTSSTEKETLLPEQLFPLPPITVIVGHYGVGKTNLSLNLAKTLAETGVKVTLVDLDVVNPYFRSSDYEALLASWGVDLVAPVFAGSTLDVPSLSGKVDTAIEAASETHKIILDVGGDDVGATAFGRYGKKISEKQYAMYYVVNAYRNLIQETADATELLYHIEKKAGLKATGIINNSHLQKETTEKTVLDSLEFAENIAKETNLPLVATTIPASSFGDKNDERGGGEGTEPKSLSHFSCDHAKYLYFVQTYVVTPWEN